MSAESESHLRGEARTRGRLTRRIAQYGVLAVVLLSPLLIGGAPAAIQVLLSMGALAASIAWVISRRGEVRLAPFVAMAAVAVAGTLLQLLPLPAALVETLSPEALAIRRDAALGRQPAFLPLTLDVPATVLASLRGFAFLAILLVTAKATHWRGRTLQFAVPLALAGGFIGLLSFAQRWFGAETILGIYAIKDMPGSGFFGTFVNGNHAASFFTLTALMCIGGLRETDGSMRLAMGLSAAVSVLAVITTGSRMGLIGLAAAVFLLGTCWLVNRLGTRRGLLAAGAVAAVCAPLVILLAVSQRKLASGENATLTSLFDEQKVRGWKAALAMTGEYPWTGVGRGAFEGPAAGFRQSSEMVRLVFPENLLVQMLSEWGIPLTLVLLGLFLVPAAGVLRRVARWEPVFQAAACGVAGVLVHEFADFGLEVPGVAFPTAMALGLCAGRLQISGSGASGDGERERDREHVRRFRWPLSAGALAVWALLLPLGIWATPRTSENEGRTAAKLSASPGAEAAEQLRDAVARHPAEYYFEVLAARQALAAGSTQTLRHVNRAMRLFPHSPAPHLLAFHQLASSGRRAQAAMEYRLAVERGHNFSYEEVARKVGAANVIRAVPQQPESLLNLATAFVQVGRYKEANTASARATDLSLGNEPSRIRRMEIALGTRDEEFVRQAAQELVRIATTTRGWELAVQGLARSGDLPAARAALKQAMSSGEEPALAVRGARILLNHGDVDGARLALVQNKATNLPLAERLASERMIAEIADKQGNADAAAAARSRARLLERLQQSSHTP